MLLCRISYVTAHTSYIILISFCLYRVDTFLTCRILYEGHNGYNASVPTALYCIGPKNTGNWTKIDNGTEHLIARFNATTVDTNDYRYNVTILTTKGNGALETLLSLTRGDNGTFTCTIGNETEMLRVPMLVKAGGTWHGLNISLQCAPINKNASDPEHIGRYPYNITWFLNSTLVGRVEIYNDTSYNVTYNTNSSFVQSKNVTFHDNWGHTNNTRPVCLTCVVTESGPFGLVTLCSPNTTDLSVNHSTVSDILGKDAYSASKTFDYTNDITTNVSEGSSTLSAGFVIIVYALVAVIFLVHFRNKGRSNIYSTRRIYGSYDTQPVKIYE